MLSELFKKLSLMFDKKEKREQQIQKAIIQKANYLLTEKYSEYYIKKTINELENLQVKMDAHEIHMKNVMNNIMELNYEYWVVVNKKHQELKDKIFICQKQLEYMKEHME